MKPQTNRTPEMKAQQAAERIHTQDHLDELLRQFSPVHHAGLIERLRPHLKFEPEPFEPEPPQ